MNKNESKSDFSSIGSSSLLVIFLVLCMVSFAVLSLSSARSDYTFSQRLADHKTAYYKASAAAESVTDSIDKILSETAEKSEIPASAAPLADSEYAQAVTSRLNGIGQIEGTAVSCSITEDNLIISFEVPVNDMQQLHVGLRVLNYAVCSSYYEVQSWRVTSSGTWEEDQTLKLMPIGS